MIIISVINGYADRKGLTSNTTSKSYREPSGDLLCIQKLYGGSYYRRQGNIFIFQYHIGGVIYYMRRYIIFMLCRKTHNIILIGFFYE